MPSQIFAPVPVAAAKHKDLKLFTSADLLASLRATLDTPTATTYGATRSPFVNASFYGIAEEDYTVPAPPPPSPVGFRNEHWPLTMSASATSTGR